MINVIAFLLASISILGIVTSINIEPSEYNVRVTVQKTLVKFYGVGVALSSYLFFFS